MQKKSGTFLKQRSRDRESFLRKMRERIYDFEADYSRKLDLFSIFIHLLDLRIAGKQVILRECLGTLMHIREGKREAALALFMEVAGATETFGKTDEEKRYLLARLLRWAAIQATRPFFDGLLASES